MNMFYGAGPKIFEKAKMLRGKMTREEKILWSKLNDKENFSLKFRRQHPIANYVADFYCHPKRLVIEIDGGSHKYLKEFDQQRENDMQEFGIKSIRFSNEQINKDLQNVLAKIKNELK